MMMTMTMMLLLLLMMMLILIQNTEYKEYTSHLKALTPMLSL